MGATLDHQEELFQLRRGEESGLRLGVPTDIAEALSRAVVETKLRAVHCGEKVALTQVLG